MRPANPGFGARISHTISLRAQELLRYKRAGEAGTEASRQGLPAFGEKRSSKPGEGRQQELALPGTRTAADAVVTLDRDDRLALSGGVPFAEAYAKFKKEVSRSQQMPLHELSKAEHVALESYAADTGSVAPLRRLSADFPAVREGGRRHCLGQGFHGVHWRPPLAGVVEACPRGLGSGCTQRRQPSC